MCVVLLLFFTVTVDPGVDRSRRELERGVDRDLGGSGAGRALAAAPARGEADREGGDGDEGEDASLHVSLHTRYYGADYAAWFSASRGAGPSVRSPMTLRWISLVPAQIELAW